MLVLSRKQNETILIDGRIKIEVLKAKGNTIKLGISAPSDVKILRGELAPFGIADSDPAAGTALNNGDPAGQSYRTPTEGPAVAGVSPEADGKTGIVAEAPSGYQTVHLIARAS